VLPDALELERSHKRFSDAVLLRRVRKNELLMQAIGFRQVAIEFRGVDQRVVGSQRNVGVALWQSAESRSIEKKFNMDDAYLL